MSQRGFAPQEYQQRVSNAQALLEDHNLDALFLTTEADFRYFTGFQTRFWESPTRPWYLILPAKHPPLAIIPTIGVELFSRQSPWNFVSWQAPDYQDDGVTLLADSFQQLLGRGAQVGIPSQIETHLRMPLDNFGKLKLTLDFAFSGDFGIVNKLRNIKSQAEIEKISKACKIADNAFARIAEIAHINKPLSHIFRDFQRLSLEEGADYVTYLAGAAGQGGYDDVISPASDEPLKAGDILMLDTGLIWDGYFCDFNRNFAINFADDDVLEAHAKLIEATRSAFELAKAGNSIRDLFYAMHDIVAPNRDPQSVGRFGHGLGMQLTEGVSLIPQDDTIISENMVLTLEPSIQMASGKILVHEENIHITSQGAHWLSNPYKELLTI